MVPPPPSNSLVFKVTRREPELVTPAKPTPHEFKLLSDIEDQEGFRMQIAGIVFYQYNPSMRGKDPVKVIREALAKTLVFYYPFAGRLRELEGHNRKLAVECTGEGVLFTEADADVTLEQFGLLHPPFPCFDELLFDVPGSDGVLNCPLLHIQVTRTKCQGFIFAIRVNHTMCDGVGLAKFLSAVAEMARGAHTPSVQPVWQRELLNARNPPQVTCTHHEYREAAHTEGTMIPLDDDLVQQSFFFGPTEASALRRLVPPHHHSCSIFDLLTACLWQCRTIALQPNPTEEVRLQFAVNARNKFNPPLPKGYYGNCLALPVALTTAEKLCKNSLGYALELVMKAKNVVTEDYIKSVADLMVLEGRPRFTLVQTFAVSDLRGQFGVLDFGWGSPAYSGPVLNGISAGVCFYISFKNGRGEDGILVSISLPATVMGRFVKELDSMLKDHPPTIPITTSTSNFVKSAL